MPKVKVIKRYNDRRLKVVQEVDAVFEVDADRAAHLVKEGVVEVLAEPKTKAGKEG